MIQQQTPGGILAESCQVGRGSQTSEGMDGFSSPAPTVKTAVKTTVKMWAPQSRLLPLLDRPWTYDHVDSTQTCPKLAEGDFDVACGSSYFFHACVPDQPLVSASPCFRQVHTSVSFPESIPQFQKASESQSEVCAHLRQSDVSCGPSALEGEPPPESSRSEASPSCESRCLGLKSCCFSCL